MNNINKYGKHSAQNYSLIFFIINRILKTQLKWQILRPITIIKTEGILNTFLRWWTSSIFDRVDTCILPFILYINILNSIFSEVLSKWSHYFQYVTLFPYKDYHTNLSYYLYNYWAIIIFQLSEYKRKKCSWNVTELVGNMNFFLKEEEEKRIEKWKWELKE